MWSVSITLAWNKSCISKNATFCLFCLVKGVGYMQCYYIRLTNWVTYKQSWQEKSSKPFVSLFKQYSWCQCIRCTANNSLYDKIFFPYLLLFIDTDTVNVCYLSTSLDDTFVRTSDLYPVIFWPKAILCWIAFLLWHQYISSYHVLY